MTFWEVKMKIAICDDSKEYVDLLSKYINFYFSNQKLSFKIYTYDSGEALLNSKEKFDLVFLDIEMEFLNGIETAYMIKQQSNRTIIFIVTAYHKYLDDAMDLNVFRYIDKPINPNRVYSGLDKAINLMNNSEIIFKTRTNGIINVLKSDIVYVEVIKKDVIVTTVNASYVVSEKMEFFKNNLCSSYFAIPHNSYIINFKHVTNYKRDVIQLMGKYNIPISQKKQPEIRSRFIKFFRE